MHNPSMYELLYEKSFGTATSIPMSNYKVMRETAKAMPLEERLSIANSSQIGSQLFPLACGAQFSSIAGVDILCLSDASLRSLLTEFPNLQAQCPTIKAIDSDPVPLLGF